MIATYKLLSKIQCSDCHSIDTIEIPSPKEGRFYARGLEHCEFVIGAESDCPQSSGEGSHIDRLRSFSLRNPDLDWDERAILKEINPDISLAIDLVCDGTFDGAIEDKFDFIPKKAQVKFHLVALPEVIAWEENWSKNWRRITWEREVAAELAVIVRSFFLSSEDRRPYIVGLVGCPGSGKSTSSAILKTLLEASSFNVLVLPMDGYHLYLKDLETEDLVYRRGAEDTFDKLRFKEDLKRLTTTFSEISSEITFPGFDHQVGDPVEDSHRFKPSFHEVVIVEGLYLLRQHWGLSDIFHQTIFINSDIDLCMDQLKVRNLCIPGYTEEEIRTRVDAVDRVNAETVKTDKKRAGLVVNGLQSAERVTIEYE